MNVSEFLKPEYLDKIQINGRIPVKQDLVNAILRKNSPKQVVSIFVGLERDDIINLYARLKVAIITTEINAKLRL